MIDGKKLINKLIIRREKLRYISIAALHNNMNYVDTVINEINSIIDIINEQPKVGEWIPCSERLPEEYGSYVIAWFHKKEEAKAQQGGKHYYEICEYSPDEGWISDYTQCPEGYDVVAWQLLPEPWEGENE